MKNFTSRRLLVAAAAVAVAVGVVGAAAASKSSSNGTSFLDRVASHLGISTQKLQDATKAAAIDQVNADLKAGRITQAQADAMKKRIEQGDVPLFFGGVHRFGDFGPHGDFGHHGPFGHHLSSAADYLGLTVPQLLQQLASGKSLADVAKAQDKSVDGLKDAILADAKTHLDQAVKDGYLTEAQAKEMLSDLQSHLDDIVNGKFPGPGRDREFRWRPGPTRGGALWRAPAA